MGNTLASQVEQYINGIGKVPRSAVYGRFDLVAKRAIDRALDDLGQSRRLVVGPSEVAPVRSACADAELPKKRIRKSRAKPASERRRTFRDDVLALMTPGQRFTREDLTQPFPWRSLGAMDQMLARMVERGELVRETYKGYWLPDQVTPPDARLARNRVLAAFQPGEILNLRDVKERLPDLGRSTIGKALAALCRDGRMRAARLRGYWLAGTLPGDTAP